MTSKPTSTPWGHPDDAKKICDGLFFISTSSHGGFYVAPERRSDMPAAFRSFKPWAGQGWYEEDCDWAIVVASFPGRFTKEELASAFGMLSRHRDYYEKRGAIYQDGNI